MEDFRLKVFVAVVGNGGFTKAARSLGISQPAVSQNVSELERLIGSPLLERTRGEMVLTEKGKALYKYAERILYWYDRIDKEIIRETENAAETVEIRLADGSGYTVGSEDGSIVLTPLKNEKP